MIFKVIGRHFLLFKCDLSYSCAAVDKLNIQLNSTPFPGRSSSRGPSAFDNRLGSEIIVQTHRRTHKG